MAYLGTYDDSVNLEGFLCQFSSGARLGSDFKIQQSEGVGVVFPILATVNFAGSYKNVSEIYYVACESNYATHKDQIWQEMQHNLPSCSGKSTS